jgi:hypothetical protein
MRTFLRLSTLLGTICVAGSSLLGQAKIEQVVAGPANAGGLYIVSQNEARVAYIGAKGTRTVVLVDGVEGPLLDELITNGSAGHFSPSQIMVHAANAGGKFNGNPTAVIFSENGAHFAYIGRQGNDYIVIHDGKEAGRGPRSSLALDHNPLGLSPSGKNVFWGEMKMEGSRGIYRLIMNGKAGPWAGHQNLKPVFSPDDNRYAYAAGTVEDYQKLMLIIDGKVASYVGHTPQFTADGKTLLTLSPTGTVLVDGKPAGYAGISVEKIVLSPVGSRFAVIMRKRVVNSEGLGTLYLDGREVAGTEGAVDITFSPDGKRYALRCRNLEAKTAFMVIDGKKGTEYSAIADKVYWTPDSSKVLYQIVSSGRNFVIVNTEEFAVQTVYSLNRGPFSFAKKGEHYAFSSVDGTNRNFLTIVNGKQVLPAGVYPDSSTFEFSDNGSRYAYAVGQIGRGGIIGLVDNGTTNDALTASAFGKFGAVELNNPYFILSADGKYMAWKARTPQNANQGLYVNDKLVHPTQYAVAYPAFTPDGQHLVWLASELAGARPGFDYVVYVDGQAVAKLGTEQFLGVKGSWRMGADGVLTCIGIVGDVVKRFRITPGSDMNIEKMIAQASEKQASAIADAAAAKKKADDDATAVAAKKKADDEAYAAKRKADLDAKNKARLEALEARKKAAADAAAARQKK